MIYLLIWAAYEFLRSKVVKLWYYFLTREQ